MSYLLSAVAARRVGELLERARKSLRPGGRLLLHDFMLDDDRSGPAVAALWLLNAVTIDPDVASLTPAWLDRAGPRRRLRGRRALLTSSPASPGCCWRGLPRWSWEISSARSTSPSSAAGRAATRRRSAAPSSGLETVVIDAGKRLGGACLFEGCIPSKALLHVAARAGRGRARQGVRRRLRRAAHLARSAAQVEERARRRQAGARPGRRVARGKSVEVIGGRAVFEDSRKLRVEGDEPQKIRFKHAIVATGSAPGPAARPRAGQRAHHGLHGRAGAPRDPRPPARDRRRLHRSRAGPGLRGARQPGHAGRDDRRAAARRRPRPRPAARPALREARSRPSTSARASSDLREIGDGDRGARSARATGRVRSRAGRRGPAAGDRGARPRDDAGPARPSAGSSRWTSAAAPPTRTCGRSATSPASRCWPTARCARARSPPRRSPAGPRRSTTSSSPPSSSPIPRSPGVVSPSTGAAAAGRDGEGRAASRGPPPAARPRWGAPTGSPSSSSTPRPGACSAWASSAPAPAS